MPTPEGLLTVTVHGQYVYPDLDSTPRQGTVTFTPSPEPIRFPAENVIVVGTRTATLDANGEFTIDLVATDNAGQDPDGWVYTVTPRIIGEVIPSFPILLPYTVGTVELADVMPSPAAPTYLPVVGPQGPPGIIQTVNGLTGINITLIPSDIGAIALTEKGAASGVATLDGSTHVPAAQLPDLSGTYINVTQKGAASGVATLDGSSKVTVSQLNLASVAPPSVGTGAVGASNKPAREDHTHDGVALTGNQTVAGIKTFSSSPIAPTPTTATQVAIKSYTDGAQTFTGAKDWTLSVIGDIMYRTKLTGDSDFRIQMQGDGTLIWGPGNVTPDTTLARTAAGVLTGQALRLTTTTDVSLSSTGHAFQIGPSAGINLRMDGDEIAAVNNGAASALNVQPDGGTVAFFGTTAGTMSLLGNLSQSGASGGHTIRTTGDSFDRLGMFASGSLGFGSGAIAQDIFVYRNAGGLLQIDGATLTTLSATVQRSADTSPAYKSMVTGDTVNRWEMQAGGKMSWGPGVAGALDTVLYRNGVADLKTDGRFVANNGLSVPNGIGSFRRAYKTADESVSSANTGTTLQNDDHLVLALEANSVYEIDGYVAYEGAATPAGDLKLQFTVPSGGAMRWTTNGAPTGALTSFDAVANAASSTRVLGTNGATVMAFSPKGWVTTAGTAGNLTLQWAQNASNATSTTLKLGSWIQITRIA